MKRYLVGVAVGAVALVVGSVGTALALPAETWVPPGDTIVRVTGNAEEGFGIEHYDGTGLFPPTLSEALAECGEYDTKVARVRCRAEVRTWYRDLADIKDALRLARQSG
ncbi:MAG TPA: hypothetical protein VFI99_15260 [Nocardioides sp.]|nr:hypothetical protein [Nocardioides sp.]